MRVEYSFWLSGKEVTLSEECKGDKEVFKFLSHANEIFGNTICDRDGEVSDKVSLQVRKTTDPTGKKEYEYFEMVCIDPSKPKCHYAKREYGTPEDNPANLFPKNKNAEGHWEPWRQFKKE